VGALQEPDDQAHRIGRRVQPAQGAALEAPGNRGAPQVRVVFFRMRGGVGIATSWSRTSRSLTGRMPRSALTSASKRA
jgi:hypothetical protein